MAYLARVEKLQLNTPISLHRSAKLSIIKRRFLQISFLRKCLSKSKAYFILQLLSLGLSVIGLFVAAPKRPLECMKLSRLLLKTETHEIIDRTSRTFFNRKSFFSKSRIEILRTWSCYIRRGNYSAPEKNCFRVILKKHNIRLFLDAVENA